MKNFVLIGASGYVAPRHMRAIKDTGNNLVAAFDIADSVGIIDSYFPQSAFFTEFERFDRHVSKLINSGIKIDYVTICSPNYLHDSHIRFGLRIGADVICEKPLVLNPWNLPPLKEIERASEKKVNTILQLRLHPALTALKAEIENGDPNKVYDVDLTYCTSRGNWYYASWKGDVAKSGGIATNIGIHFFDMLEWLFGDLSENVVHVHEHDRAAGYLRFKQAKVKWFLSINYKNIPDTIKATGARTYRSITVDGKEIEFSGGFTDLHTRSYEQILDGNGFSLNEAGNAIQVVFDIRNQKAIGLKGDYHPLAALPLTPHPFDHGGEVEEPKFFKDLN